MKKEDEAVDEEIKEVPIFKKPQIKRQNQPIRKTQPI